MDPAHYSEVVDRIRGSGSDVLINLTTGPGARFMPGDDDPQKPGPGTTMKSPTERVQHMVELKPEICSLDMGSMNMGAPRLRQYAAHLETMAVAIRDAGVHAGARGVRDRPSSARQAHDRERPHQGARHVPDLPRHRLGAAGDSRGHELHAQPAAARTRRGSRSAYRCTSFRWWRRPCCSAAIRGSGSRTTSISRKASSRPATRRWSRRLPRSSRSSATSWPRPADAREILGLKAATH